MKYILTIMLLVSSYAFADDSTCYGTTADGRLEGGVKLPARGKNFVGYSAVARAAGRTYVDTRVSKIIVAAYQDLEKEQPVKRYKYAETGFKNGGQFKPHKNPSKWLVCGFYDTGSQWAGRVCPFANSPTQ